MLKISILKVENPSCLWGRVVQGPIGDSESSQQYDSLLAQMNLFYHDVTQDLRSLKPTALEEGQVCVVYWSVLKSWCRAVVESIIMDSVSCQARCLLVDHGERIVIPSDQIRVAMQKFLQLPFWVRRFHLAGIKPTTLRVSLLKERAELINSSQWDSSATLYLHNLLQASTRTEVVLMESETDSTSVELYLTVGNIKICVNDDLVSKKFAFYDRQSSDEVDPFPVMLKCVRVQSPRRAVCTTPTKPTTQTDVETAEGGNKSLVPEYQPPPGSQSKNRSESDPAEDTDSSLAAALTKNLSLFRCLKFLNPDSSFQQQAAPSVTRPEELKDIRAEETTAVSSTGQEVNAASSPATTNGESGADGVCANGPVEYLAEEQTRSVESGAAEKMYRSEEDWACVRLLEWLNPEPVNPNPDNADDVVVPSDPRRSGILVNSPLPVEPCSSLEDAPLTDALRWVLRKQQSSALSPADRYSWPAVARGSHTVIVSPGAEQPTSYLPPLLTHILLNSIFTSLSSSAGPIAVLLCPGWEKVQLVFDLLEELNMVQHLHPLIVLLGVGKDEAKAVKIPKNCLLLVTTPFSLVRLLSCHCFLFLRLYHLVLDEADQLFTHAPEQMATILQHFQKVTTSEENASCPQQLVAVAKRWTSHMEGLLANHMPSPCVVMTVPEEAALYGNVQQIILMTEERNKISVLLGVLDFTPEVGQKTLIVTNGSQEVEDVFKAVSNKSAFCLQTHEGTTHLFDFVVQQWRKDIGPGTHVILVTTNECLKCLGIRDASCVVHYGFPTSPRVFGSRLFSMAENFRNLSDAVSSRDHTSSGAHPVRSVLLISERNARHVVGLLRYLVRTGAPLPPELLAFARGVNVAREDQKRDRPFCSSVKSFGVCRDSSVCPDRHRFFPQLDQSLLPASGVIEVIPLYIKSASVFFGRIVRKEDGGFQNMESEMTGYYGDKKPTATDVLEGGLYAVQEDQAFHRVRILSVPDRGDRLFFSVQVRFIDVGKEEEVKSHQLLVLPEKFHSLPAQAVEIVVCRVKPVDAETQWHPKVTRAISQKIRGLQHRARAVFSLGNTVFVDPMVRVTQVPGMKTVINEYNVLSEIVSSGMGVRNPEHVDLLKALCLEGEAGGDREGAHTNGCVEGPDSLETRIVAEEKVLAEAFRAAEASRLSDPPVQTPQTQLPPPLAATAAAAWPILMPPQLEPCEPLSAASPLIQTKLPVSQALPTLDAGPIHTADLKSAQHMRIGNGLELCQTAALNHAENGLPAGDNRSQQVISAVESNNVEPTKSFHPQVRWFQTPDSVNVTVKLLNPESQRCDFHPDRVVYSGRVNGRSYRAELTLSNSIDAPRCSWEMKSNEPVLKLAKIQPGSEWERLVKNKNIFVSYDMDHVEDDEDKIPNGVSFVEDTGEENLYVRESESGSESD